MGTPFQAIYDSFLARISSDEWVLPDEMYIAQHDWFEFLKMAIFRFRFPRKSLEYDTDQMAFNEELDDAEIQMLAIYMKHEWVKRCVASWENIRQLYADKDFSQANHLDKLIKLEASIADEVHKAEGIYDRVWHKRPSRRFSQLAGKNHG